MAYPTNPVYKLVKSIEGTTGCIITVKNGVYLSIPLDPNNTDYQEYLEWAKTNTAEAAD